MDVADTRTCANGHTWTTSVLDITGCPHCSRRRPKNGAGLDATHPALATLWSSRNGYPAALVSAQANRYAWFTCADHPHEFVGVVASVVNRGGSCAVCAGKQIRAGFNDLQTLHPDVAAFWHPNNARHPSEVAPFSHTAYQWLCPDCGFEWSQPVSKRVRRGPYCTACRGRTLAVGINDFASRYPDLVPEWDASNDRGPHEVLHKSTYEATWRCRVHPEFTWKARVHNRANGTGCPVCGGQQVVVGLNDLPTTHPGVSSTWDISRNDAGPHSVSATSGVLAWWTCATHGSYAQRVESRARGNGCVECSMAGCSHGERELREFVTGLVGASACVTRYRGIPGIREVDLYLPEQGVAIEYNGIYWHSDRNGQGRGRWYHHDKRRLCLESGVRLIQVWEDNWRTSRPIVEAMLRSKLGVEQAGRLGARNCTVDLPARAEVRALLERSHVQGHRNGSIYLGLRDNGGALVAAMVVTRTKLTWTIDRYAAAVPVQGGFGKLLARLRTFVAQAGGGRIVTFSDNDVSDGSLYTSTGFTATRLLAPDYAYLVGAQRVHKFNFRKERFRRDPQLEYREGLTESQLARLNRLLRVWDSGKIRWELSVDAA